MVYALVAILRFQRRLKKYMEGRRAVMKLIAFKLFVAIQVLQRVSELHRRLLKSERNPAS